VLKFNEYWKIMQLMCKYRYFSYIMLKYCISFLVKLHWLSVQSMPLDNEWLSTVSLYSDLESSWFLFEFWKANVDMLYIYFFFTISLKKKISCCRKLDGKMWHNIFNWLLQPIKNAVPHLICCSNQSFLSMMYFFLYFLPFIIE